MNNIMKLVLAKQAIEVASTSISYPDFVSYEIESGKIIEKEAFTGLQIIKEIFDSGLPLTTLVEYKNKIAPVMEHILSNVNWYEIINYFNEKLTQEDVKNLTTEMVKDIYEASSYNTVLLDKIFKLGFNFNQGEFDELGRALSGDIEFFELCMQVKPDFKLTFKYEDDLTLDQHLAEDIEYCKNDHPRGIYEQKRESLLAFLKKAREIEELKDNLNNNLNQKTPSPSSMKKL